MVSPAILGHRTPGWIGQRQSQGGAGSGGGTGPVLRGSDASALADRGGGGQDRRTALVKRGPTSEQTLCGGGAEAGKLWSGPARCAGL